MIPIKTVMDWALQVDGKAYVFGAENDGKPPDKIRAEDCSELIQNACDQSHVVPTMPDGVVNQYPHCQRHGADNGDTD